MQREVREIWHIETNADAEKAFIGFYVKDSTKYDAEGAPPMKDQKQLPTFLVLRAVHLRDLRASNPIKTLFATRGLRLHKSSGDGTYRAFGNDFQACGVRKE